MDKSIPIEWLNNVDNGLQEPDLVIYLYKDTNKINNEIYENEEFQSKLKESYEKLFSTRNNWIKIDSSLSEKEVFNKIKKKFFK